VEELSAADCPFCDNFDERLRKLNPEISRGEILTISWAVFRNHVGRHMKDLATFAIPRYSDEDDRSTIASDDTAKAAVAMADADLLQKELAPREFAAVVGSEISDVLSIGTVESHGEAVEEVESIPDAPDYTFIGLNGHPEGKQITEIPTCSM